MRRIVAVYPNDHLGVNTITLDPMWRSPFGANIYMAPYAADSAGNCRGRAAADVRQRGHVGLGALRRSPPRDCDTAIVGCGTDSAGAADGAGGIPCVRRRRGTGTAVDLWTAKSFARFIPPNSNPIVLNGTVDHNVVARHRAAFSVGGRYLRGVSGIALVARTGRRSAEGRIGERIRRIAQSPAAQRPGGGADCSFAGAPGDLRTFPAHAPQHQFRQSRV